MLLRKMFFVCKIIGKKVVQKTNESVEFKYSMINAH